MRWVVIDGDGVVEEGKVLMGLLDTPGYRVGGGSKGREGR